MRSGSFLRYYNITSIIHSINPLCKILGFLIFIIMTIIGSNIRIMCCLFLILLFIMALSNVSFLNYIRPLFRIKSLFIIMFLVNILFGGSIYNSLVLVSRLCLILMYSSVLLYTTTTNEIAFGFSSLFRPLNVFGFPVSRVSMVLALILNFIPSLFLEYDKINRSYGFSSRVCFKDKISGVFIPMFVGSIRRSRSIYDTMMVKNFCFNNDGSCLRSFKWNLNDFYMISCHLLVLVFVLIKEVVM